MSLYHILGCIVLGVGFFAYPILCVIRSRDFKLWNWRLVVFIPLLAILQTTSFVLGMLLIELGK